MDVKTLWLAHLREGLCPGPYRTVYRWAFFVPNSPSGEEPPHRAYIIPIIALESPN